MSSLQQKDQKEEEEEEVFLTFFCSTRSIQSQEVGGDYNQKMKPIMDFRINWEHGIHSVYTNVTAQNTDITYGLQIS